MNVYIFFRMDLVDCVEVEVNASIEPNNSVLETRVCCKKDLREIIVGYKIVITVTVLQVSRRYALRRLRDC